MDNNLKWVMDNRINRTMDSLRKNNMESFLVKDSNELFEKIEELVDKGSKVSCGESVTLFETNVIDYLRNGRYNFLDRYKEGLNNDEIKNIYRNHFFAMHILRAQMLSLKKVSFIM